MDLGVKNFVYLWIKTSIFQLYLIRGWDKGIVYLTLTGGGYFIISRTPEMLGKKL